MEKTSKKENGKRRAGWGALYAAIRLLFFHSNRSYLGDCKCNNSANNLSSGVELKWLWTQLPILLTIHTCSLQTQRERDRAREFYQYSGKIVINIFVFLDYVSNRHNEIHRRQTWMSWGFLIGVHVGSRISNAGRNLKDIQDGGWTRNSDAWTL